MNHHNEKVKKQNKYNVYKFSKKSHSLSYVNKFYLERLVLKKFRNHSSLDLIVPNFSTLIYGENGCGKTNVLEAISLLSQGRGLRKSKVEDYLFKDTNSKSIEKNWGVNADIHTPNGSLNIGTGSSLNSNNKSRVIKINSENSSQIDLARLLKISWVTPQMCILFEAGMTERRRFLDRLTSALDPLHISRVYKYEKVLRQRNNLILQFNDDKIWIKSIEKQISELSVSIVSSRLNLVMALNDLYENELKNNILTINFPPVEIKIKGVIEDLLKEKTALEVENDLIEILEKNRKSEELYFQGPHTSQIEILNRNNNKSVDISSTGEQKLILISVILSHGRLLNIKFNMAPILLLDDIVEHLDERHRNALFLEVNQHFGQAWFTSTNKYAFESFPGRINKIHLPKIINDSKGFYDNGSGEI